MCYLDNNSTTPLAPEVIKVMKNHMEHFVGNPSSVHGYGRAGRKILTDARVRIGSALGVKESEILFTSGGTESMNLLIHGFFDPKRPRVISSRIEHPSVLKTLEKYENVDLLPVTSWGAPTLEALLDAITPETGLIVLSAANHETGVLLDLEAVARVALERDIPLVVDGIAWLGKSPFFLPEGVSAMGFSGHKIHGPTGTGFCFVRKGAKMRALHSGGLQERGLRAGTENLLGVVGLAEAVSLLNEKGISHMRGLQEQLEKALPEALINGEGPRVANVCNLAFSGHNAEELLILLDLEGIAVSHGSACTAGSLEPSQVLLAMGYPIERVKSSLRISFSCFTKPEEIAFFLSKVQLQEARSPQS